jgi:hypothetical protein
MTSTASSTLDLDIARMQRDINVAVAQMSDASASLLERGVKLEALQTQSSEINRYASEYERLARVSFNSRLRWALIGSTLAVSVTGYYLFTLATLAL